MDSNGFLDATDLQTYYTNDPITLLPQYTPVDLSNSGMSASQISDLLPPIQVDTSSQSVAGNFNDATHSIISFADSLINLNATAGQLKNRQLASQIAQQTTAQQLQIQAARANTTYAQQLRNVTGISTLGGASPNQVVILLVVAAVVFAVAHGGA